MDRSQVVVYGAVAVILGATVASGPAVGLVDLTTRRFDGATLGQGNLTVDRVDAPATARLDRGLRSRSYYLKVPDARIRVAAVTGQPLVSYRIAVPAMGYSRATTHFLGPGDEGWVTLSLRQDTFPPERVDRSSYDAVLSVVVRANDTEDVLYNESITVEVAS